MRISRASMGAILLALFLASMGVAPAASADNSSLSTPAPDKFKAQMDQYRIDRENYLNAIKQRSLQMKAINIAFKTSCDSAASAFKVAMSVAKSPDAKNSAITARKSAIAAAVAARDAAIALLGEAPSAPIEPVRPIKASKNKKG